MSIFKPPVIISCLAFLYSICSLPCSVYGFSEERTIDSLVQVAKNYPDDTNKVRILLSIADNIDCSDTIRKLQYANMALALSGKLQWHIGTMNASLCVGNVYQMCLHVDIRGVPYFQKALTEAGITNDTDKQIKALYRLSVYYYNMGKYSEAINYYKKAIQLSKETGQDIQALLGNLGSAYAAIGDYVNALDCYQQLLKHVEETHLKKNEDSLTLISLLITVGEVYVANSQYEKAKMNYDSASKLIEILGDSYATIALYTAVHADLGKMYEKQAKYGDAIEHYEMALKKVGKSDASTEADILNRLARIYIKNRDIPRAIAYAQQSFDIAKKGNNEESRCDVFITLGMLSVIQQHYAKAAEYFNKALEISVRTGMLENTSEAWQHLSEVYQHLRQFDKALVAYQNYIATRDSVYNIEKAKELTRMEMQAKSERDSMDYAQKRVYAKRKFDLELQRQGLQLQRQRLFSYAGFGGLLLLVLVSFLIFRNYNHEKKANRLIQSEKEKSDNLLLNILPGEVAAELKEKGNVRPKEFGHATVMFADFVNFTAAGERMGAQKLVNELDACFVAFDEIIARCKVEKIKTVGDAYLAAAGMPIASATHAEDMVEAAIAIRNFMVQRRAHMGEDTFEVRIGVHSGPVVAGIVGVRKFAYDIWGDTVNIAARMEQNSIPGRVNISDATYELVKTKFLCTYRGEIDAKNKGKLKMYFVE